MTLELALENDIVKYLQDEMPDRSVEPYQGVEKDAVDRAISKSGGIILVSQSWSDANYSDRTARGYAITIPITISMLNTERRANNGIYMLLNQVRELMFNYQFYNYSPRVVSHRITPEKIKGIFGADIELEFKLPTNLNIGEE